MSKLGYFVGGALVGVIGTAIATCVADSWSSSGAGSDDGPDAFKSAEEENEAVVAESFVEQAGEEATPA